MPVQSANLGLDIGARLMSGSAAISRAFRLISLKYFRGRRIPSPRVNCASATRSDSLKSQIVAILRFKCIKGGEHLIIGIVIKAGIDFILNDCDGFGIELQIRQGIAPYKRMRPSVRLKVLLRR